MARLRPQGGPPNNWLSEFGSSAWEFDQRTGQYYCHTFLREQPDLNWRNPDVREAIHDVMRFWLERGVDGFRVDVIWHLIKDPEFRDNPPNPDYHPGQPPKRSLIPLYTADLPEVHDVIEQMRDVVDAFGERVLIGEIYLPLERLVAYYGRNLRGCHLPLKFSLLQVEWQARAIAALVDQYEGLLPAGGWPNWVLGNHDRPRIATRIGREQARIAAMLLLTLRGTPTIYYGDEIGMVQVPIPPDRLQDPFEKNVSGVGRDGARTPMQWNPSPHAGFSTAEPWLPLAEDFRSENVENARRDPTSIYHLYRRLIAARRTHPALTLGVYHPIVAENDLLLYTRELEGEGERILVALNLSDQPASVGFPHPLQGRALVSNFPDRDGEVIDGRVELRPLGGLVVALSGTGALSLDFSYGA